MDSFSQCASSNKMISLTRNRAVPVGFQEQRDLRYIPVNPSLCNRGRQLTHYYTKGLFRRLIPCEFSGSPRAIKKEMAAHPSILAWKIPWMDEPGRLQSMELRRVGHDWATSLSCTIMHWRRKWQPTPALLPGESQGQSSLVGCRLWGCTESDMTKVT